MGATVKKETRYIAVAILPSLAVAFVLAALFGAAAFVLFMMAYLVTYSTSPKMHEAIERIANGKEEKS